MFKQCVRGTVELRQSSAGVQVVCGARMKPSPCTSCSAEKSCRSSCPRTSHSSLLYVDVSGQAACPRLHRAHFDEVPGIPVTDNSERRSVHVPYGQRNTQGPCAWPEPPDFVLRFAAWDTCLDDEVLENKASRLHWTLKVLTDVTACNRCDFFNVQGLRDFAVQLRFEQPRVDA